MSDWPAEIKWFSKIRVALKKETGESFSPDILGVLIMSMLESKEPITFESLVSKFDNLRGSEMSDILWKYMKGKE